MQIIMTEEEFEKAKAEVVEIALNDLKGATYSAWDFQEDFLKKVSTDKTQKYWLEAGEAIYKAFDQVAAANSHKEFEKKNEELKKENEELKKKIRILESPLSQTLNGTKVGEVIIQPVKKKGLLSWG